MTMNRDEALVFIKFLLVGLVNTFVGLMVIYFFLHVIHLSYWLATITGNSIGACVSFVLNRHFTFRSERSMWSSLIRFIFVVLTCYFLAYYGSLKLVHFILQSISIIPLRFTEDIAVIFGMGLYTILNFIGQKKFVF
jgi:putative flippase GtrA